jgi:L-rhamnose mutarotase
MQRYAMVIGVKADKIEVYKKLHVDVWPGVLAELRKYHVKNYSIFWHKNLLFGYLEYHGNDYEADMRKVASTEITQRWWKLTEPCQESLSEHKGWTPMQSVFYMK